MDTQSPPDEGVTASRRERGKLAQREYRKRHANKFRTLQEENKRLKDAISHISKVVAGDGRTWPELEVALIRAWGAAGATMDEQDDEDLGHAFMQPNTESVSSASSGIMDAMPALSTSLPGQIPMLHSLTDAPVMAPTMAPNPHNPHWSDTFPLPPDMSLPLQLSQGLANPPRSISGFLEWICANYTMALWRETRAGGFTSRVEDLVMQNMVSNYSSLSDGDPITLAMVNRLGSYHDNYGPPRIQGIEALADRYDTLRLQAVDTLARRGWWKTPKDIEEQIQSMSQPEELDQIQACMDGRSNDPIMTLALARLYIGMCRNFVRFPEGPRWNTMYVTVATGLWRRVIRGEGPQHA
ncbi:hypothetical protein B0I35DRAFT_235823 [Stachybotrys elegans]|uniref:BZIP domain-containing protein n=1 Tax=Stachybotrys elegans TaxID=80388 RepID=A0A8K0SS20_9HYPO|nr:hypothetical protein B0I35DRAFT_235823 [Stachybotrys elegans]